MEVFNYPLDSIPRNPHAMGITDEKGTNPVLDPKRRDVGSTRRKTHFFTAAGIYG